MTGPSFEREVSESPSDTATDSVQELSGEERTSSSLMSLFWSSGRTRLRAVWRILFAGGALFAVLLGTSRGIGALGLVDPSLSGRLTRQLPFFIATVVLLYVASRLDHRRIRDYGFDLSWQWWRDFAAGTAFGIFMHAGIAAAHYGLGWAQIKGVVELGDFPGPFFLAVAVVFVQFTGVALWEEALFRGVFILNAAEGLSGWDVSLQTRIFGAWGIPTLVFGGLHFLSAGGVGASPSLVVVSAMVSGVYFGVPYILTGSLALPIGLHLGSNFADKALIGGTAPLYADSPAVLRLGTDFPAGWDAIHGLGIPAQILISGLVLLWVYGTRGSLRIDSRLRQAALER